MQSYDIALFRGDPNRGEQHDGWMYSLRVSGRYVKADQAYPTQTFAVLAAVRHAQKIQAEEVQHGD